MVMVKMKTQVTMMVRLVVMVTWLARVLSFNLNTDLPHLLKGMKGTYYGYSVALWEDVRGEKWLVVGAPRGRSSTAAENIYPLGDIHICKAFGDQCSPDPRAPFLSTRDASEAALDWGPSIRSQGIGFGETVYTQNKLRSKLLICAPRYPRKIATKTIFSLQPRGACYILPSFEEDYMKIVPYHNLYHMTENGSFASTEAFSGNAIAGMSGIFSLDERDVYMGGPYAFYAQGVLIRARAQEDTAFQFNKQFYGDASLDFSMTGWSMVAAKFDGKTEFLAASSPWGDMGLGSVTFYDNRLDRINRPALQGEDIGAMFGYSLGVGDFDGNGVADLLVAAPYSLLTDGLLPDAGKVYVYYDPCKSLMRQKLVLEGKEAWGLFGKAVTSPGDLNGDGYDDVVVGAPGGEGRVYIYNGQRNGLIQTPTQIIRASEISPGLRGFGFSLDGGVDIDNNEYPDLIIGAVESDTAVLLRSAPVSRLEVNFRFEPETISLKDRACSYEGNNSTQKVACSVLVIDLEEMGPQGNTPLELELEIELDEEKKRLGFLQQRVRDYKLKFTHTLTSRNESKTIQKLVFVKRDKEANEAPGTAKLKITHRPSPPPETGETIPDVPKVLETLNAPLNYEAELRFDCDDVNTCFSSDLVLHAQAPEQLVVGGEQLEVNVTLEVKNDTAFMVKLYIQFPSELQYQQLVLSRTQQVPDCKTEASAGDPGHDLLTCVFFSHLIDGDEIPLTFLFGHEPINLLTNKNTELTFNLSVTSNSKDLNEEDNTFNFVIKKVTKVNLHIEGTSEPEVVEGRANESLTLEDILNRDTRIQSSADKLGPRVIHRFSITNRGPTPLLDAKIQLHLPRNPEDGLPLYLMESPRTSGPIECSPVLLNPLTFIDPNRRDKADEGKPNAKGPQEEDVKRSKRQAEEPSTHPISPTENAASTPPLLSSGSSSYSSSSSSSSSSPRGPLATSNPSVPQILATPRPLIDSASLKEDNNDADNANEVINFNCSTTKCEVITCDVFMLMADGRVTLDIIGYVTVGAFQRVQRRMVSLTTSATFLTNQSCVSVNEDDAQDCDYEGDDDDNDRAPKNDPVEGSGDDQVVSQNGFTITAETVMTIIKHTEVSRSLSSVAPWKLFIAVLVALLIIVIIFAILYKVGFFKRKHRLTSEQREMLRASQKRSATVKSRS